MYTIEATFLSHSTAECQCLTLAELVAYLEQWLPMSVKIVCRDSDTESEG